MNNKSKSLLMAMGAFSQAMSFDDIIELMEKEIEAYKNASTEEEKEEARGKLTINCQMYMIRESGVDPEQLMQNMKDQEEKESLKKAYEQQKNNN